MRKEKKTVPLRTISRNDGQLDWLPKNPRQWTKDDVERTARSITEDTDFLEDRPLLLVPGDKDGKYVVFAGNLRREGAKAAKLDEVPAVVYYPETDEDRMTIKRRAMKDNGSFGKWDFDLLANEWDDLPLLDLGVPSWDTSAPDLKLSTEGREGGEGYDEFVDKFKPKLTTDDCYTPTEVYDIVRDFVNDQVAPLAGRKIIRPFFPGGNYEDLTQYPKGCVVLDNPPFSIYSKIVRFYLEHGIDFFLFGPSLTLLVANADVCFVVANIPVVYENGAVVSTGFVTNMVPGLRIWVEWTMREKVIEAQKSSNEQEKYNLPDQVVTSARLGKICARNVELKIDAKDCKYVHDLDGMKEIGKGLYGGGFLLNSAATAAAVAAATAAASEKEANTIELSDRERAIIAEMDKESTYDAEGPQI